MHFRSILKILYFWKVDSVQKISKYIPTKAGAQAGGLGFQKSQARPKAASGQAQGPGLARLFLAWLGLASGFRPEPAHHYLQRVGSECRVLLRYLVLVEAEIGQGKDEPVVVNSCLAGRETNLNMVVAFGTPLRLRVV